MLMMEGSLSLIACVQVALLLDSLVSMLFTFIFVVLQTRFWYLYLLLPLLDMCFTLYLLWSAFLHTHDKTFKAKLALSLLSQLQTTLVQILTPYLIDRKYRG